jgi:hypothetical protein
MYQDGKGENKTKPCPKDTFGIKSRSTSLSECAKCAVDRTTGNKTGALSASDCVCRRADLGVREGTAAHKGYFVKDNSTECNVCVPGADCSFKNNITVSELIALPGYWRNDQSTTQFADCSKIYHSTNAKDLAKERCCPGTQCADMKQTNADWDPDAQCAEGYQGLLCGTCATGYPGPGPAYVRIGSSCVLCPGGWSLGAAYGLVTITAFLVSLISGVIIVRTTAPTTAGNHHSKKTYSSMEVMFDQLKILVSWLQILSMMTHTFGRVPWGNRFTAFSQSAGAPTNLDLQFILSSSGACSLALPFLEKFQISIVLPFFVVGLIKLAEVLAIQFTKRQIKGKKQARYIRDLHKAQRNQGDKIALLMLLLMYPSIANQAFSIFRCRSIPGIAEKTFMEKDLSVQCLEGTHLEYLFIAAAAIAVYAVGVPAFCFWLLYKHREHLHDHSKGEHALIRHRLGGLYLHMEEKWYFWEILVLIFKLLLTGLMCVVAQESPYQALVGFLICAVYAMMLLRETPYYADSADRLAITVGMSLSLTLLGGYIATENGAKAESEEQKEFLDTLDAGLLAINIVPVIVFLLNILETCFRNAVIKGGGTQMQTKVAPSSSPDGETKVTTSGEVTAAKAKAQSSQQDAAISIKSWGLG